MRSVTVMCQASVEAAIYAAGRYGDAKVRSISVARARSPLGMPGFPDLDLADLFALTFQRPPHIIGDFGFGIRPKQALPDILRLLSSLPRSLEQSYLPRR